MSTTPFPTNTTATVVDAAIDGVANVAMKLADTAIFAEVPILSAPILDVLTEEAVKLIINEFYKQFATWVSFEIIDFQGILEENDSQKALIALKAAQASGDSNAIQTALLAFQQATIAAGHIDGSAHI